MTWKHLRPDVKLSPEIYTNKAKRNLFACFRMAGHALCGMALCFGHTGVTLMLKMIGLILSASDVILRPPEARFFEIEGFV